MDCLSIWINFSSDINLQNLVQAKRFHADCVCIFSLALIDSLLKGQDVHDRIVSDVVGFMHLQKLMLDLTVRYQSTAPKTLNLNWTNLCVVMGRSELFW